MTLADLTSPGKAEKDLRQREAELRAELAGATILQKISTELIQEDDPQTLYEKILDAAVAIMKSDVGTMQLLDQEKGELHLLASKGLTPEAEKEWRRIEGASAGTSCAVALREQRRVVVPDLENFVPARATPDGEVARRVGMRSAQTTPLVSRSGSIVGMVSTHWRTVHEPSDRDLRLLDVLARQAADLIERHRSEQALRESLARYHSIVNQSAVGIVQVDADGRLVFVNDRYCEITGRTREDLLRNARLGEITHPDDLPRNARLLKRMLATGEPFVIEKRYVRPDGKHVWVLNGVTAIFGAGGSVVGCTAVCVDVTDRKVAEVAVRRSERRYRTLSRTLEQRVEDRTREVQALAGRLAMAEQEERGRIARVLHDDLQQVLFSVHMRLHNLADDVAALGVEELRQDFEEVRQWLSYAVRSTRELSVDLSPPVLKNEGLREALMWLSSQMREKQGLDVMLDFGEKLNVHDEGLRSLLFQTIRELLFNVVKHAGVLEARVEARRQKGGLLIEVRDEGSGFDLDAVSKEPGKEEGFGLFSARERLRLVGGAMSITSAIGAGTQVTITVPLRPASTTPHTDQVRD